MQVTGAIEVRANGELLLTKRGTKISISDVENKSIMGDHGVAGYVQEPTAPFIEFTMIHRADVDLDRINGLTNATISVRTDTGQSYVLQQAWRATPIELTGGEGETAVRFEGVRVDRVS